MIINVGLGEFGSTLLLIVHESWVILGDQPLSHAF